MVKKVLDIISPKKQAVPEETGLRIAEGRVEEKSEPKPKITYIPKKTIAAVPRKTGIKLPSNVFFISKLVIVLMAIGGTFLFFDNKLAKATITIWPETEDLKSEVQLTVSTLVKDSDFSKKTISGSAITAEKTYSGDFTATGKKNSQNMAQGTVKIYNNFSKAQFLIKGTRLQAPLEKFQPALSKDEAPWFKTAADVTVGAKSSADVLINASGMGEKYNIDPSIFSIPGLVGTPQYTFVYGQSFEKFRGGEKGVMPQIKQEDIDSAKNALTKKAEEEIRKDIEIMVPENHILIADTVKIEIVEAASAAAAGTNVEKFTYQVKARATGLIFDKNELDAFSKSYLLSQAQEGQKVYEQSFKVDYAYLPAAASAAPALKEQLSAALKVEAGALVYLPSDEVFIKKGLAEKKVGVAKLFLMNQPKIKNVEIDVSPFWRTSMPKDIEKIQVNFNFD